MSNHDTPQTEHIDVERERVVQQPHVTHTSDPRGKPTWVENIDAVVEHTEHTTVDSDAPYTTIISDGSRKGWVASDTFTHIENKR